MNAAVLHAVRPAASPPPSPAARGASENDLIAAWPDSFAQSHTSQPTYTVREGGSLSWSSPSSAGTWSVRERGLRIGAALRAAPMVAYGALDATASRFASHYHALLQEPRQYNKKTVFLFAAMTGGGKFLAAYGAFLAAEQFHSDNTGGGVAGCVVGAAGTVSFLVGATKFSQAVARIDPTVAKFLKAWSITGGAVLIGAYTCKGLAASRRGPKDFAFAEMAATLNWLGVGMMGFSFPIFVASSQAVYGYIVANPMQRCGVGLGCIALLGPAMGVVPSSRFGTDAEHIGTQLAAAALSFGVLFGAGLMLSAAWDQLGQPAR